jgi:hypothetical protein
VLIRDIDPNLISENAATAVLGTGATTTGTKVVQGVAGAGGVVGLAGFGDSILNDRAFWDEEIIKGIPYSPLDVAMDLGFVGIGVAIGAFAGPAGPPIALAANATRVVRIVKILRAVWSKIIKVINPIENIAAAGLSTKEFLRKVVLACGSAMTWSLAVNTIISMLTKSGINVNITDKIKKIFSEDVEQQPTQDQIRDPAWCAANGIEPTIDPALEKDPAFVDAFIAARHYHKSIVKYNGKIYPVYLETDYDGPDAPSGFTISESADLARIKLLTRKLLNG